MFFEPGFLGTAAPFYLDLATCYFFILPFLILYSISYAIKKQYKKHYISQFVIIVITLVVVVIFELGLRLDGGFQKYSQDSSYNYVFLLIYLLAHIVLAVMTLSYWTYFVFTSYKAYKTGNLEKKHKQKGRYVFGLILLTSLTGLSFYALLFI